MNLSEKYLQLHEGGLVKLPIELRKKVIGEAKTIIMGIVLNSVSGVIRQYNNILTSLDKKHPSRKQFEKIVKMLDKYYSTYSKKFKARKSNVRKKKILIKSSDMKPYKTDDFHILLTTNTKSISGDRGQITHGKEQTFEMEIPLMINFGSLGGTIDLYKSMASNSANFFMSMRDGKELSAPTQKILDDVFPKFKEFQKKIQSEMEQAISILHHELTHVIQQQTGQGYNHSDLKKEGGYIQYKKHSNGSFEKYSVGAKEVKAYLLNQVDDFYRKVKRDGLNGNTTNDFIVAFVSDRVWFTSFADKSKQKVIRDFTTALKKDSRFKQIQSTKLASKVLSM